MSDLHPIAALDHVIDSYRDFLQTDFRAKDEYLREAKKAKSDLITQGNLF